MPALVALYLSRKNVKLGDSSFDALVSKLQKYHWRGNIRQLFKSLEAWLLNCELDGLEPEADNFPVFKDLHPIESEKRPVPAGCVDFNVAADEDRDFDSLISDYEKAVLSNAMRRHNSIANLSKAINLPRSTLDAKRRKHGLL